MSTYDEVLSCPDTHCRKEALDALCREKMAEGMRDAVKIVSRHKRGWHSHLITEALSATERAIRQAAKELNDAL